MLRRSQAECREAVSRQNYLRSIRMIASSTPAKNLSNFPL